MMRLCRWRLGGYDQLPLAERLRSSMRLFEVGSSFLGNGASGV